MSIDQSAQAFYENLRQRYFPPERDLVPAHLSLFHQLPDDDHTVRALRKVSEATSAFPLTHPVAKSIGRGVAVFFESANLKQLHATLAAAFEADLIPQDRQRLRPHIVVQNKVDPELARATLPRIQAIPLIELQAIGLTLWRYLGGPWEHVADFPFAGAETSDTPTMPLQQKPI